MILTLPGIRLNERCKLHFQKFKGQNPKFNLVRLWRDKRETPILKLQISISSFVLRIRMLNQL